MFVIRSPAGRVPEREYIVRVVMETFLGLEYRLTFEDRQDWLLELSGHPLQLTVADDFLRTDARDWLKPSSLPQGSLDRLASMPSCSAGNVAGLGPVPILFDTPESQPRDAAGRGMFCALDVFGSVFFMLTRYEEVVLQATDAHGRFPATASLLHRAGLLDRPLANEYVEILRDCMLALWPGLPRKPRSFRIRHHHDVDQPFMFPFKPRRTWARAAVGDVLKRRDPRTALARTSYCASMNLGVHRTERFPTFERLMDVDERAGARGVYFFIPRSVHALDGSYDLEHPAIERLLQRIASRGHEIGYHGSYLTFDDATRTASEVTRLREVCARLGITQSQWGGRQHFLRWRAPITWRNYEAAGLDYDSTVGFADHAGFRCGTCYEFPVFDLIERRALRLTEQPLIVMECSVLDERYMNLPTERALSYMSMLKERCRAFAGDFTLLWHNSRVVESEESELYDTLVAAAPG